MYADITSSGRKSSIRIHVYEDKYDFQSLMTGLNNNPLVNKFNRFKCPLFFLELHIDLN